MIYIDKVSKNFGKVSALKDVSCAIDNGVTTLLGLNGAGKTTLMRILSGYMDADSGSVRFDSYDKNDREQYLSNIGYVPENNSTYGDLTVYEFIKLHADLWKIDRDSFISNATQLISNLELEKVINRKISTLSKGYRKRVSLAAALVHSPSMLVLDEPTDGLDPKQKQIVRGLLQEYSKEHIVLISTHIMEEVEAIADRVIILHNGNVLMDEHISNLKNMAKEDKLTNTFVEIMSGKGK